MGLITIYSYELGALDFGVRLPAGKKLPVLTNVRTDLGSTLSCEMETNDAFRG